MDSSFFIGNILELKTVYYHKEYLDLIVPYSLRLQNCLSKYLLLFFIFQPLNLCDIEQITSAIVTKEDEISQKIDIQLKDPDKEVNT